MTGRRRLTIALLLAALALDVAACFALATVSGPHNDFFPRWLATRLWLERGWNPYGPEVDLAIQAAIGTAPIGGDRFVFGFVYPGYVALLLSPLALLPSPFAATLWLLLIQACGIGGALLCWRANERERNLPPTTPLPALIAAALFPATIMNQHFLQFSAVVFAGLAFTWWLLLRGRDRPAAAMLLLAAIKPTLGVLPALALVTEAAHTRNWRFLATALSAGAALLAVSIAALPNWPTAFVASTLNYAAGASPQSAGALLASLRSPSMLAALLIVLIASAAILAGWLRSARRLGDTLGATALATIWLIPPLYEWNNVILLGVLIPALRAAALSSTRRLWTAAGLLFFAYVLTALFYATWPGQSRLIWPLITLAVYLAPTAPRLGSHSPSSSGPLPSVAVSM